jgi:hypothetical protein
MSVVRRKQLFLVLISLFRLELSCNIEKHSDGVALGF